MRVEMQPKRERTKWCDIKIGQCFMSNEELYMKMDEADGYNAVCLSSGEIDICLNGDFFEVVPAHVVVE